MSTTSTTLGPYHQYEIPDSLVHTFYESDGTTPTDLTGYTIEVTWWVTGQSPPDTPATFSGTLTDAANGVVTVPWSNAPEVFEETGLHEVQIWAGDSVNRHPSEIFRFMVLSGVASSEPSV